MPTLQIRDLPQDLYDRLRDTARQERRSLAQQATVLLYRALGIEPSSFVLRRRALLDRIRSAARTPLPQPHPSPEELIRQDRDER